MRDSNRMGALPGLVQVWLYWTCAFGEVKGKILALVIFGSILGTLTLFARGQNDDFALVTVFGEVADTVSTVEPLPTSRMVASNRVVSSAFV